MMTSAIHAPLRRAVQSLRQKSWLCKTLAQQPQLKQLLLSAEKKLMPQAPQPTVTVPSNFNQLLHELRSYELRAMPSGAKTFLSAGCAGRWFFDWIAENYGPVARHIGLEYYTPRPSDLPYGVEWIANTVGNMDGVNTGEVDLLFSGQNIEHLWPEDIVGFLLESHRVLRPNGTLVLDSPNRTITEAQSWSHPEHIIEFTTDDMRSLLLLAGFNITAMRGLWLCHDAKTGASLPFDAIEAEGPWPALRRIAYGRDNPEDSFCWWVEATRANRAPDKEALTKKVTEIYNVAWPERTSRLKTIIGKPSILQGQRAVIAATGSEGVLLFGPYMPLRAGHYRATFTVAADCTELAKTVEVAWCDVFLSSSDRAATTRHINAGAFSSQDPTKISLTFNLDQLEFGVQFRLITTGKVVMASILGVELEEITLDPSA